MTYKNTKTGFVFTTDSEVEAPDWIKVEEPSSSVKEAKPKKKVVKKNELCD